VLRQDGSVVESGRLTKLMTFSGLDRVPVEEVQAGDIIAIAGPMGISVHDHIIIGRNGHASLRGLKLI